jgi:hypothetical protein
MINGLCNSVYMLYRLYRTSLQIYDLGTQSFHVEFLAFR